MDKILKIPVENNTDVNELNNFLYAHNFDFQIKRDVILDLNTISEVESYFVEIKNESKEEFKVLMCLFQDLSQSKAEREIDHTFFGNIVDYEPTRKFKREEIADELQRTMENEPKRQAPPIIDLAQIRNDILSEKNDGPINPPEPMDFFSDYGIVKNDPFSPAREEKDYDQNRDNIENYLKDPLNNDFGSEFDLVEEEVNPITVEDILAMGIEESNQLRSIDELQSLSPAVDIGGLESKTNLAAPPVSPEEVGSVNDINDPFAPVMGDVFAQSNPIPEQENDPFAPNTLGETEQPKENSEFATIKEEPKTRAELKAEAKRQKEEAKKAKAEAKRAAQLEKYNKKHNKVPEVKPEVPVMEKSTEAKSDFAPVDSTPVGNNNNFIDIPTVVASTPQKENIRIQDLYEGETREKKSVGFKIAQIILLLIIILCVAFLAYAGL